MEQFKNNIAKLFFKIGLSANAATLLGLICAFVSGFVAYKGVFVLAGAFLLLSGFFDLMDGAIARLSGKGSAFGGILDSSLDRYGDAFILTGILFYFAGQRNEFLMLLASAALAGSFAVSYVRARAECVVPLCRVGFWERGERIVYLSIGLLVNNLGLVLLVLAVGTNFTAACRLLQARALVSGQGIGSPKKLSGGSIRRQPLYWIKVAVLVGLALFFRPFLYRVF